MNRIGYVFLGVFVWAVLAIPGGVWAHSAHTVLQADSPFDGAKAEKRPHCELKLHHSAHPVCPHTLPGKNPEKQFRTDCGGSHTGVSRSLSSPQPPAVFPALGRASSILKSWTLTPRKALPRSPVPHLRERPPREI